MIHIKIYKCGRAATYQYFSLSIDLPIIFSFGGLIVLSENCVKSQLNLLPQLMVKYSHNNQHFKILSLWVSNYFITKLLIHCLSTDCICCSEISVNCFREKERSLAVPEASDSTIHVILTINGEKCFSYYVITNLKPVDVSVNTESQHSNLDLTIKKEACRTWIFKCNIS